MIELIESKLSILAGDEAMINAIKWLLNKEIKNLKPIIKEDTSDEIIGQQYRAYNKAHEIIENLIIGISSYENEKSSDKIFNKEL